MRAQVVIDGAAIYQEPNFDSSVIDYVGYQANVVVSKRAYAGAGGLGLFHRIRHNGKIGYITDTDIRVSKSSDAAEPAAPATPQPKSRSKAWEPEEEKFLGKAPLYLTRFLGGGLAQVNFSEKFSGRKYSDNMLMYGLRMTGPGTLFNGPPLDFNLWFSLDQPAYLSKFSNSSPTGFLLFGDVMAMLPMVDVNNWIVSYGLGLMYTFTKYRVPVRSAATGVTRDVDSLEFRIGASTGIGVGRRFGKYLARFDAKYYIEKTSYLGLLASFQMEY